VTALDPARSYPARAIMIIAAGPLAQRLATRGSEPGWSRPSTWRRTVAFHESGHCLLSAICGYRVDSATVIPHRSAHAGYEGLTRISEPGRGVETDPEVPIQSDCQKLLTLCRILAKEHGIRPIELFRALRNRAEAILEANLLKLSALAVAMERRGSLPGDEISRFLNPAGKDSAALRQSVDAEHASSIEESVTRF
jgi:hypothetical protein